MPDRPHAAPPSRRLTGATQSIAVLRNLGLLGTPHDDSGGGFSADDGQHVPVQTRGAGPPVVLLHGLGCSHRHWSGVMRRLAPAQRVYAWDARGHGAAQPLTGEPVTLPRLGRDVAQLFDKYLLDGVLLVGHSMGALTALQYLALHGTARVRGLCLVDQSPRVVTDEEWRLGLWGGCSAAMLQALIDGARHDFAATVMREIDAAAGRWLARALQPDAFVGRRLRQWLASRQVAPLLDLCASLVVSDFRALLARLNLPLLVVLGGRSAHYADVPLEDYYKRTVAGVQVLRYERSGHSPHVAEPARFARDLLEFSDALL